MIKFFNTLMGRIIISIIWGLGLSCLFRKVCKGRNCIIYKAPDNNIIKKNIYKYDKKCYKFNTEITDCKNKKSIVKSNID